MDQLQSYIRENRVSAIALLCFALLLVRVVGTAIYNIYFHPLSRFPGPLICKVSRIPHWVAFLGGHQATYIKRLHDKYGDVLRICPDELSYTDAQAWKDIYGLQKGRPENYKSAHLNLEQPSGHELVTTPSMVNTASIPDHSRVRRLFSPAFSDRALKQQEPLFKQYTDLLMTKLYAIGDRPVDMTTMFNFTTFDIMAELAFGEPLHLLENSKYTTWVSNMVVHLRALPIISIIKYYPLLNALIELVEPKYIKDSRRASVQNSIDRVDKRLEKGSDKPDLWNLLDPKGGGEKLSLAEMYSNANIFMIAGSETTATTMTALTYLLLTNPEKLDILKKEVREQAATEAGLKFEALANLPYLNACIQEAIRIYPAAPLGLPRTVAAGADGGQLICGEWVPAGTVVSVHHYSTYHSAANFRDPERFAPERWLPLPAADADGHEHANPYRDDNRAAWQPFSYGPRNCLGMNMAWHEMRLVMATLVAGLDMELCEESRGWLGGKSFVLWEKIPLMVRCRAVGA